MSLLSGMNDMLTNKAALEAAQDMFDFEEDLALEADELIDTMVDGMAKASSMEDDIDEMENDFEEAEELDDEIESEDNFTETIGKSANEAAALTGDSFLSSLTLDKDDPITTKDGSVGSNDATATHKDNFSEESTDNNDPINTKDGSIGADSTANPENNYSDTSKDTTDPITTKDGSVGTSATAKDPAVESALFYGELLGEEEAMEGFVQKIKEKAADISNKKNEKKTNKRLEKLNLIGISQDIDNSKFTSLLQNGKYSEAKRLVQSFGKKLEAAKTKISDDDPDASNKRKTADSLIKTNCCLLIKVDTDATQKDLESKGVDPKTAKRQAMNKIRDKEKDPAIESYINECLVMLEAFESAIDPEATSDGSIGQDNSKASFEDNFSDGKADTDDPIITKDGSEGQADSKATFDDNFSDGDPDKDDPIKTEDGSIGQGDSTAKDPAIESSVTDELEELNSILLDDFDDDDDI